MLLQGEKREKD